MPKQVVAVDYERCRPDNCEDSGVCTASLVCEYGSLTQQSPYEEPEVIPSKWCHGCSKCVQACPLKAIRVIV
jgi:translation initiation factor RLI1